MPRTRSRGFLLDTGLWTVVDKDAVGSGSSTSTYPGPTGAYGLEETITDTKFPNFAARQKAGEVMLGPLTLIKFERDNGYGSFMIGPHGEWGTRYCKGDAAAVFEACSPQSTGDVQKYASLLPATCLVSAYAKMNQATLSGMEICKDLDATVGMLRHPFRGATELLSKMLSHRKKRLGKTAASAILASKNAWLEYRYGWRPLIGDSQKVIAAALKKRAKIETNRLVSRAGASKEDSATNVVTLPNGQGGALPCVDSATGTVTRQTSVRVNAGVVYCIVNNRPSDAVLKFVGARPNDIPAGIWECIPYSFVVDWFVNVSDWLNAVTPNPSVSTLGNWVTTVNVSTVRVTSINCSSSVGVVGTTPRTTYSGSFPDVEHKTTSVVRAVNQPMPSHPTLIARPLSALQSVDALALSLGKIRSGIKLLEH